MKRTPKIHQTESAGEARWHQTTTNAYLAAGLCHSCAAQAAYGHQLGWSKVNQPCTVCRPIVAAFPQPQVNDWRSKPRDASKTLPAPVEDDLADNAHESSRAA